MTHFILCPDSASVRVNRRRVAEQLPSLGIVVGTWHELQRLADASWLAPPMQSCWQQRLEAAVKEAPDSFWSASLRAVPSEAVTITAIVGNALAMLLDGIEPGQSLQDFSAQGLDQRTARYLTDLFNLHQAMGGLLPPQLHSINRLLELPIDRMLRPLLVYQHPELLPLNPWQSALVNRLNQTADADFNPALIDLLAPASPSAPSETALGHLQRNLFEMPTQKQPLDNSIQWLAVRDYLLEAEVAAGMLQQALRDDQTLQYRDIAILLPNDQTYHGAVSEVFSQSGIPLSGLSAGGGFWDLGGEAVSLLLTCLNGLSPVMALASLLVSPLMPWSKDTGNRLAQSVINNRFDLKLPEGSPQTAQDMLKLVRDRITTPEQLRRNLGKFPTLLTQQESLLPHCKRVQATCDTLVALLEGKDSIPWQELMAAAIPSSLPPEQQGSCTLEGVAVFYEGEEPWRNVRRMFVLGCNDGHYPAESLGHQLFTDKELEQIRDCCGYRITTKSEQNRLLRHRFRRQISSVSEQLTFLLSCREPTGKPLSPSASVTFSAALFEGASEPDALVLELDSQAGRDAAFGLPLIPDQKPQPPRQLQPQDLAFGMNLLELNRRDDGSLKPESPSRLEKLMVSPLAWLFERLGVESQEWQPETLDIMSKGTLAHAVFEHLFAPDRPLPESQDIEEQVPKLLDEQVQKIMPFLNRSEWKVERMHLQQEILKAALQWREILHQTGAKPVAVEISLQGVFDNVPIHGNADLLLELPPNRLYVVDYKKSTSKDRRKRMKAGYDHQAELYRTMIRTGGLKEPDKAPAGLAEKLADIRDTGEIGTLYYLMNDQKALADTSGWLPGSMGNPEEMQANASANAMQLIRERFAQLRDGKIELNTPTDEKEFKDKRGISAYALKGNPLVAMWMKE